MNKLAEVVGANVSPSVPTFLSAEQFNSTSSLSPLLFDNNSNNFSNYDYINENLDRNDPSWLMYHPSLPSSSSSSSSSSLLAFVPNSIQNQTTNTTTITKMSNPLASTINSAASVAVAAASVSATETIDDNFNLNYSCPSTWDGIYQWPLSPSNSTVSIPCSNIFSLTIGYIEQKFDQYDQQEHYAHRICNSEGRWAWNNWTNYTECLNLLALQEKDSSVTNQIQDIVSYLALILLIASLVSLIISIVIFMSFKPLQCLRIRVHKNLCVALLINCCLYIVMNSLVGIHKLDLSIIADWFCKSLKVLNVYTSMATVNWMFVEGFLFHRRLYAPFHTNTRIYVIGYYVVGWIVPAVCVIGWAITLEFVSVVADKPCWEGYRRSNAIMIVSTPMIVAVGINFVFLINIIRILVTKLRADNKSDHATIKAIKATALLIPLLGIHHIVVFYNPSTFNRKLANVYIIINVLFQSVQGIIVAVLYCFTNNEVRNVLNSAWSRRRLSHSFMPSHPNNGNHHMPHHPNHSLLLIQNNNNHNVTTLNNPNGINHLSSHHPQHRMDSNHNFDDYKNPDSYPMQPNHTGPSSNSSLADLCSNVNENCTNENSDKNNNVNNNKKRSSRTGRLSRKSSKSQSQTYINLLPNNKSTDSFETTSEINLHEPPNEPPKRSNSSANRTSRL